MKKEKVTLILNDRCYPCIQLHADDLIEEGYDISSLEDEDLCEMASKIGESLMDLFWVSLRVIAEERYELVKEDV